MWLFERIVGDKVVTFGSIVNTNYTPHEHDEEDGISEVEINCPATIISSRFSGCGRWSVDSIVIPMVNGCDKFIKDKSPSAPIVWRSINILNFIPFYNCRNPYAGPATSRIELFLIFKWNPPLSLNSSFFRVCAVGTFGNWCGVTNGTLGDNLHCATWNWLKSKPEHDRWERECELRVRYCLFIFRI